MKLLQRINLLVLVFAAAAIVGLAQVNERDVRAHMEFLASDAMQGRGSGTVFEKITAEYVGLQMQLLGLEPAGDPSLGGRPSYVQHINIGRNSFALPPKLKFGATTLEHGKDMLVMRATAASLTGALAKTALTDKSAAGAAAFVSMGDLGTGQNLMQSLATVASGDAPIIIVEETAQTRSAWATVASRRITWTATGSTKPVAIVVVSKQAAAELAGLPAGTTIEFTGELAPAEVRQTWNAAGKITGTDKNLGSEVVLLSSHLDHVGVRPGEPGDDKIFNGADDDASGTTAVLEIARALANGRRPKRTVYFVAFGSEEAGGLGSRHFADNLPFAKEKLVANLQFEMIGRPDAKVKAEELWLTGYERSNLGPELAKRGAKLVQDPHPDQNFFQRSDNYTLARQGIIAHTVSSFGLHKDYHRPSDEIDTIDFVHMTRSINSMVAPITWLVNSDWKPAWNPGKNPAAQ
ncbi:MAG TPA: M20/M25/M40 family metallo-hydrolase [Pyrinomonadaceae bacterium]|nr:M20/M25/M40 family metallo-hydrolase [Pyrinomonadaceae bacterium]